MKWLCLAMITSVLHKLILLQFIFSAMLSFSNASLQSWIQNYMPLVRIQRRSTANIAAKNITVDGERVASAYRAVFGNVPDAEMKDILKGSLYC
jgi:hypothetical protein